MRKLFTAISILFLAIVIGYLIHRDPGSIMITFNHWQLETSIWIGLVAIILFFLVAYSLLRFYKHTLALGEKYRSWDQERGDKKARQLTHEGLCHLAEGNWQQAEQHLLKGAKLSPSSLINYLSAARAAQEQGAFEKRDNYLRQAHQLNPEAEIAIVLTQAQLQIDSRQWEQALATLKHLNQLAPHHHHALKLLAKVHLELKDWEQLHSILPKIKKFRLHADDELNDLQEDVYSAWLANAINANNTALIEKIWSSLPREWRYKSSLAFPYANYLINNGQSEKATTLICKSLKRDWHTNLVLTLGMIRHNGGGNNKALSFAEQMQKSHPRDPNLLLSLGRLYLYENLMGKARDYLQQSYDLSPNQQTLKLLGHVYETLNRPEKARECYRMALDMHT